MRSRTLTHPRSPYAPFFFYQVKLELQMSGSAAPYTVVGSTFEPGEHASFMFYVYSEAPHDVLALDVDGWQCACDGQTPEVHQPPPHREPPMLLSRLSSTFVPLSTRLRRGSSLGSVSSRHLD